MASTRNSHPKQRRSIWSATTRLPAYGPLDGDRTADVCIIGAGISGLSTAYMLAIEGRSVIVVDDGPLADGMTAVTTAHLANAVDDRYYHIERLHGEKGRRWNWLRCLTKEVALLFRDRPFQAPKDEHHIFPHFALFGQCLVAQQIRRMIGGHQRNAAVLPPLASH